MKDNILDINELLESYANLSLSAYDNIKLLSSVLRLQNIPVVCYQASLSSDESQTESKIYCIESQGAWLHCGVTNDYCAKVALMCPKTINGLSQLTEVDLPLLGEQQIAAMMMQYAHFDHC